MKNKGKRNFRKNGPKSGRKPNTRARVEESVSMSKSKDMEADARRILDKDNSWEWYAQNPQLVKDYASYPFGNALGNSISNSGYFSKPVPGLMTFEYFPTVGVAKQETDPINVAMRKMYSFVRYANSGAKNYDAPDMMLYYIAVDSAYMYLAWMKRMYGLLFNYTAFNRYYPKALITAMHVDFSSLQASIADFRGYINQFAVRLNQLWVPKGLSYMDRHQWMTSHIYVDSNDSTKAQTYMYTPVGFYKFTVTGTPAVGSCVMTSLPSQGMTLSQIITFGDGLLNPLITNEDIGIISGDILKAYGTNGVTVATGISEDYRVLPEYSEEVMSQFENLVAIQVSYNSLNVTQNTSIGGGYLISTPSGTITPNGKDANIPTQYAQNVADAVADPIMGGKILNFHKETVTPEEVLVATRCIPTVNTPTYKRGASYFYISVAFTSCGSEIVSRITVSQDPEQVLGLFTSVGTAQWVSTIGSTTDEQANSFTQLLNIAAIFSNFDWHPQVFPNALIGSDASDVAWTQISYPILDCDNYTILDERNLANMHMTALLSEFTVPMVR